MTIDIHIGEMRRSLPYTPCERRCSLENPECCHRGILPELHPQAPEIVTFIETRFAPARANFHLGIPTGYWFRVVDECHLTAFGDTMPVYERVVPLADLDAAYTQLLAAREGLKAGTIITKNVPDDLGLIEWLLWWFDHARATYGEQAGLELR